MTVWTPSQGDWIVVIKITPGFEEDEEPHDIPLGSVLQVADWDGETAQMLVQGVIQNTMLYLPEIRPATPEEVAQAQLGEVRL